MGKRNPPQPPAKKTGAPEAAPQDQGTPVTASEPGVGPAEEPEQEKEPNADPAVEPEQEFDEGFDPAWLEGLVWHGARKLPGGGNRYEAVQRKAQAFDVLAWNRSGDTVTIVLSDGSKHTVEV